MHSPFKQFCALFSWIITPRKNPRRGSVGLQNEARLCTAKPSQTSHTHWKWKQWKPEKMIDWCKNVAKFHQIWNQTYCWQLLTTVDNCWQLLTTVDNCWQLLTTVDNCWQLLTTVDNCWQLLTTVDNFWQLLTTFDKFGQLLTFVHCTLCKLSCS